MRVRTMRKRLCRSLEGGRRLMVLWSTGTTPWACNKRPSTPNFGATTSITGFPTNYPGIGKFYRKVRHIWRTWLSRRTRGAKMTWEKYEGLLRQLPCCHPRIMHSLG